MEQKWDLPSACQTNARRFLLFVVPFIALLFSADYASQAAAPGETSSMKGQLSIEFRLPKTQYKSTESIQAEVTFRNNGIADIKVPLMKEGWHGMFFDFLIVGDKGTQYLTKNGIGWLNAVERPVTLIVIRGGGSHSVKVKSAIDLKNFPAGVHEGESYEVVAIYRDCWYGHGGPKKDPAMWTGVAISPPAPIERIVQVPRKKE